MKKITYLTVAATLAFAIAACTDVLDTVPSNAVASGTMWTNEALTDQGVAGVYAPMRNWGFYSNNAGDYSASDCVPFEILGVSGEIRFEVKYLTGVADANYGLFSTMWKKLYEGVHRANDAIANLPTAGGITAEKRGRLTAEAKFMRAYYYMRLNELYGRNGLGVPVYTEPVAAEECNRGQSPENEVWALVEQDLTDAINEPNFPGKYLEKGRSSKGAAYAFRGRARLLQQKYAEAADDFSKVKACGFGLFQGGYKQLFTQANEGCEEMIFSLTNIEENGFGSIIQKYAGTRSAGGKAGGNGWADYMVNPAVVDLYEKTNGSPFDWDEAIPGYSAMTPSEREVYFVRDTKSDDPSWVATNTIFKNNSAKPAYLPEGNEARIKLVYADRDPRLGFNVITPYSEFFGLDANGGNVAVNTVYRYPVKGGNQHLSQTGVNDLSLNDANATGFMYYHRKFIIEGANLESRDYNPIDEPIMRYAQVLLMWAEAIVQQNGSLTDAASKVNEVRGRSSVNMPGYTFTSKEDAMEKIRNEVRREFVGEGVDFYEELRWGTLKKVKYEGKAGGFSIYDGGAHNIFGGRSNRPAATNLWSTYNDYSIWPVPRTEIEKNPNLTPTPGWQY